MKAAMTTGIRTVEIQEVNMPEPAKDEVLVKVLTAGICGGDVRMYNGTFPYLNYPIINGHEFCGIVQRVGAEVKNINAGDYVTAEPIIGCGHCYACSIGKENCCSDLKVLGVHVNGCFAEYISVKAKHVYRLPASVSPEDACMIEPYGIGMHALNRLGLVKEDKKMMIIGAGPIGMAALDLAKSMGIKVMISDMYESRLARAEKLGADLAVSPKKCDIMEEVMKFTDNQGFPAVLEATGVPGVMQSTQDYVANGGRICLAGVTNKPVEFSTMTFCNKEASVFGTRNSSGVFQPLIDLFEKQKLHPQLLRSHIFSLDAYGEAIKLAAQNAENVCKVVLKIGTA